jgi:hypothetical protein
MSTALPLLAVFAFNSLLVLTAILLHYEVLYQLARRLPEVRIAPRYRVLLGVGVIFIAHVIEIWLFALGYLISLRVEGIGGLVGEPSGQGALMDYVYLSFITFTTVGYGDLVVHGYLRYLTGVEALTGLILITWSASFLFLEMQKDWNR